MGIINTIRGWIGKLFGYIQERILATAKKDFDITPLNSASIDAVITDCGRTYMGIPPWIDPEESITTVNFAALICQEIARLTTLAIGIEIDGGPRADWMKATLDEVYFELRTWVEYACAYGTLILKVGGNGNITAMTPDNFIATDTDNGKITGAVFKDQAKEDDRYFTRLEYHRFEDDKYIITNVVYESSTEDAIGQRTTLEASPWADLEEEVTIEDLEKPLFAVLKMPNANNVEINSPYGLPVFHNSMEELKTLDVAFSRNAKEIYDSKRTVMIDSDKLFMTGMPITSQTDLEERAKNLGLPDIVKIVSPGSTRESVYQEINPTLNTDTRITGINNLLSQVGFKCGFSNGYFVLDEKTGMITATQVEADDRRTIQLIKDVRDKLEACLDQLLYTLDAYATLYDLAPEGEYEATYDFGDISYNREEDRARWWGYVNANKVPAWMYFVKFEGMSEQEAKAMVEEATPAEPTLFGEE